MKTLIHKNRENGLTLVEVLLGLVILAILGITSVTSLFYPRHLTTAAATRRLAVDAATDHLERLFAMNYLLIPLGGQSPEVLTGTYNINGQTVTTTVHVEQVPASFDYLYVRAEATYPGGTTNDPVILETYRSPMK
jgi:prepilin-type N-terminal cleavage/methylation domain-containing protein